MEKHIDNRFFEWKHTKNETILELSLRIKKLTYWLLSAWIVIDMVLMLVKHESLLSVGIWGVVLIALLYQGFKKETEEPDMYFKWTLPKRVK